MKDHMQIVAAHEKLIEALAFYADAETYHAIGIFPDRPCGEFINDFSVHEQEIYPEGDQRPGKRAREALMQWFAVINDGD